jgi:hypothetical protein
MGNQSPRPFDLAQGRLSFRKGREKKDAAPGRSSSGGASNKLLEESLSSFPLRKIVNGAVPVNDS